MTHDIERGSLLLFPVAGAEIIAIKPCLICVQRYYEMN